MCQDSRFVEHPQILLRRLGTEAAVQVKFADTFIVGGATWKPFIGVFRYGLGMNRCLSNRVLASIGSRVMQDAPTEIAQPNSAVFGAANVLNQPIGPESRNGLKEATAFRRVTPRLPRRRQTHRMTLITLSD
jgi:hypothetical protein